MLSQGVTLTAMAGHGARTVHGLIAMQEGAIEARYTPNECRRAL